MKCVGTVQWYDQKKGYGFVKSDEGGAEHFLHASSLAETNYVPQAGDRLVYEMVHTLKGPKADNVSRITGE